MLLILFLFLFLFLPVFAQPVNYVHEHDSLAHQPFWPENGKHTMSYKYYRVALHQTTLVQQVLDKPCLNIKEELHPLKPKLGILCVLFQNYEHFLKNKKGWILKKNSEFLRQFALQCILCLKQCF